MGKKFLIKNLKSLKLRVLEGTGDLTRWLRKAPHPKIARGLIDNFYCPRFIVC
jgi:hypothetical protein